jgi:hypothetical protein
MGLRHVPDVTPNYLERLTAVAAGNAQLGWPQLADLANCTMASARRIIADQKQADPG